MRIVFNTVQALEMEQGRCGRSKSKPVRRWVCYVCWWVRPRALMVMTIGHVVQ